ncbi:hypothetical protein ANANG_G00284660 [Anguilla anguilla]|uniref:Trinucleotide repeat containing 18 n=1 Tax=Anguilla anguilla TaxID=7936 RepID=A0A9D3RJ27_ANGAN|nr:hypothetical protein ANANG_G00284660 [Anguilla anguilla]
MLREEGSVIRSNCFTTRRPAPSETHANRRGRSPDADTAPTAARPKSRAERPWKPSTAATTATESKGRPREKAARSTEGRTPPGCTRTSPRPRACLAGTQVEALRHGRLRLRPDVRPRGPARPGPQGGRRKERLPGSSGFTGLPRAELQGSPQRLHPEPHREVSAMQSLIKYSGSFAKGPGSRPGSDGKGPFGGLGSMKPEPKTQHFPSQHPGKQLKRDPERPESAKSFGRETVGSQGGVEVRHPPGGDRRGGGAPEGQRQQGPGGPRAPPDGRHQRFWASGGGREGRGRADDPAPAGPTGARAREAAEGEQRAGGVHAHAPARGHCQRPEPQPDGDGAPALAGPGRWPPDPASHLVSHPWMPRPSGPSMWLSGSPYGLGPPSLHQGLPPGYPPTLPGSMPPPYQLARDPQSGQLVVIPTEHLPHYAAELMERSPRCGRGCTRAGASLQHAQELHLLSQQQLLRQQELLMIQQQAAQVMELQRSVHFAERLKASEQRAEMEDKAAKRGGDGGCGKQGVSTRPGPALHSRKLAAPAPRRPPSKALAPLPVYSKALTPLPSPSPPPSSRRRGPKAEKSLPGRPYSHPSTPAPARPAPPPPAPAASPVPPKEECVEACEGKELELQNHVSAPAQALYPEIPPGYPYQPLPAPFGSHYPYLLQPAAAADADGLAPDVPLPAETLERSAPGRRQAPPPALPATAEPPPLPPATRAARAARRATPGTPR